MVDIKKDDDLARHSPTLPDPRSPSPTLAHPRRPSLPSPTLAISFNLATLSTLATLAYTLHLADSNISVSRDCKPFGFGTPLFGYWRRP